MMRWTRGRAKAPRSLADAEPQQADAEQLATAREIVRRALDAESADGESAGRDLFRLGTA